MVTNNFNIQEIGDGRKGLFVNNVFAGGYSEHCGITQFSGNKNQIFDVNICVKFLQTIKPTEKIYSAVSNTGNQMHLQVSFHPIILSQGVQTIHEPNY